jgi:predicted transcriptional regulator
MEPRRAESLLLQRLEQQHGVRVVTPGPEMPVLEGGTLRLFDAASNVLYLSDRLEGGQRNFHMATQLAFLEMEPVLRRLAQDARLSSREARQLARIGLANYFAGALLMPYSAFLRAAEEEGYDIERLGQRFGVGFEAVCHRLSMLQRPQARGIPFIFIRVDRAGNISKRQSATHFHFSRIGGTCPLWNVYEAFAQPGRIVTQLARMPDGRTYLWVARTVQHGGGAWGAPGQAARGGAGLRHRARAALGVFQGPELGRSGRRRAHRHGLQGVRAHQLPAARLPARGPRAGGGRAAQHAGAIPGVAAGAIELIVCRAWDWPPLPLRERAGRGVFLGASCLFPLSPTLSRKGRGSFAIESIACGSYSTCAWRLNLHES